MDQNPTKESRPPINLRIKFRSENVEQFIERYAVDVSRGGIFIRTREPLAVGTQLKLDFQFQNGNALMAGDGTVVWIREFDPNRTTVPPGMGVRFDKLSSESQAVLEQLLVEKAKRERGGVPGSGSSQGGGGMAVRRPSSMFSVLEPQVSVAEGDGVDKATTAAPVAATPAAAGGGAPSLVEKLSAKSGSAAKTDGPAYRPLGTAKNPFSSGGTGTPGPTTTAPATTPANPPASAVPSSSGGPRPLSDLLPLFGGAGVGAAKSAPFSPAGRNEPPAGDSDTGFDDLNEEPTQIAGRLPSFLTSDSEATTEVPADLAESVRTAAPLPADFLPGASPDSERPGASSRSRQSLDDAPPKTREEPAEPAPVETARAAKENPEPTEAIQAPANVPAGATRTETATNVQAAAATAAKTASPAKKRSAAPVVVAVVVLGASAIFLYKFFGAQATENVTSAPATTGIPSMVGEPPTATPPAPAAPAADPTAAAADPAAANPAARPAVPAQPAPVAPPPPAPVEPAKPAAETKPATPEAAAPSEVTVDGNKKSSGKKKPKAVPAVAANEAAAPAAPSAAPAAATGTGEPTEAAALAHQIKVTSKPAGADVSLDGQSVGKTPFSIGIADVTAPHSIAVRKDGFEPFEQMIGPSSAWSKAKASKGKPALSTLKLNAKLKAIGGAAAPEGDGKATEPPATGDGAPKTEAKPDRPLPPSDQPPGEGQ